MHNDDYIKLREKVVALIDLNKDISDAEVQDLIDNTLREYAKEHYLDIDARIKLRLRIFNSIRRLDVLQEMMENENVTEIMINGYQNIFVEEKGRIYKTNVSFESEKKLEDIIQRLAAKVNRTVNESHPIVDARIPEFGARVNIVLNNVALNGPIVTIRKFSKDIVSMERLMDLGTINSELAEFLKLLVKGRYNIICSGGTGSGKTTLLNALSRYIEPDERVVIIEDSAELNMEHLDNLVQMETRNANMDGKLRITIRDLIKTSLRQRPDRIIVGEVRGEECIDMLQSLNTGHCGMSTAHANSPKELIYRLETMVLLSDNIPLQAVRGQIASAIDIIISVSRMRDASRKITAIYEVDGMQDGEIILNPLYEFIEDNLSKKNVVSGQFKKLGELKHKEKLTAMGLM